MTTRFYFPSFKTVLSLGLVLIASLQIAAQSTVQVAPNLYLIDPDKKLILVNQELSSLNTQISGYAEAIQLDELYTFETPANAFSKGGQYALTNASDEVYTLYLTELPLIHIETPNTIVDDPRVFATFLIAESDGSITQSNIGIEYRGASSQAYPKKSLRIEFWEGETDEETKDVSLLGMRSDDDWNLQAMYVEPLRLNNMVSFEVWQSFDALHYATDEPEAINGVRMHYAEVFINQQYQGVYGVGERIDRKQLKLKKHNGNIRGELYKGDSWGASTFTELPPYNNNDELWSGFELQYPDEVIEWQNVYNFVNFVLNSNEEDFLDQIPQHFSMENAANYFIFLNLLRATDNTGKNIYLAKYNTSTPYFYVPWDLDGTFGYNWMGLQEDITDDILSNGLYNRLMNDCREGGFRQIVTERWNALKGSTLSFSTIYNRFIQHHDYLLDNGVYNRESITWEDYTYDPSHLNYISQWLDNRITYLDNYFNEACSPITSSQSPKTEKQFNIYPNPLRYNAFLQLPPDYKGNIKILNSKGSIVYERKNIESGHTLKLPTLPNGFYSAIFQSDSEVISKKLIIQQN
jgi:spore coat protein H